MAESSLNSPDNDKPVIVRVKRKAFQSPLDAFWLEIHERPLKRPLLDFEKLSISGASSSRVEELKTKKVLVQHVETVTSSDVTFDVLRSFMPNSSDALKPNEKNEEGRRNVKTVNRHEQLLVKAKQRQEVLSRNARFEQIWRSRKGKKEDLEDEAIYEMCQLYDVVRVDVQEREVEVQKERDTHLEDCKMMAQFLPLLKEVLPSAAVEIEHDIHDSMSKQASDGYVYDFYAVKEGTDMMESDTSSFFPLVQVDEDDDFYDGPDDLEYETDDSNAENNPINDYPEEESTNDEDEDEYENTSESSDEESDRDSQTSESESEEVKSRVSDEHEDVDLCDWSDNADQFYEDEMYSDDAELL